MTAIVKETIKQLKTAVDPQYKKSSERFFKERIYLYGVRVGDVRKIATRMYRYIDPKEKNHIFSLCQELFDHNKQETFIVATVWLEKIKPQWEAKNFTILEHWVKSYISNWAQCDGLCSDIISPFLLQYPQYIARTRLWRTSKNRWVRRAAAVSLIKQTQDKRMLPEVFAMAKTLLEDPDDLVQKGYGWMLKVAADAYRQEVFDFVMQYKYRMPRTALRYAIEKMPKKLKIQAMAT